MYVRRSILTALVLCCTLARAAEPVDSTEYSGGQVLKRLPPVHLGDADLGDGGSSDGKTVDTKTLDTTLERSESSPEVEPEMFPVECCYDPCWTVRGGAVFLRRDHQSQRPLVNGTTPFTAGALGLDYEIGPMVDVIRHGVMGSSWDLQVAYFGIHDFFASASSATATSYFTNPTINFGARTVTTNYLSDLDSTEINFRHQGNDWMTVLVGFRWIELSDELRTDLVGSSHSVDVNNHMYGAQIGVDTMLWSRGSFAVEGLAKAGLYGNVADQNTLVANVGGAVPQFSAASERAAFAGELALTGSYIINDNWSLRSGYQALWLDGVALAPDQLDNSDLITGAATLNLKGTPIYHGFLLAAEYVW